MQGFPPTPDLPSTTLPTPLLPLAPWQPPSESVGLLGQINAVHPPVLDGQKYISSSL